MASSVERLEAKAENLEETAYWAERLTQALGGDASAWEFTGEVHDAGEGATMRPNPPTCACGHPIRFCYRIRAIRDVGSFQEGSETHVGSVCIRHIGHLNPTLVEAILTKASEIEKEIEEARKEAARAAAQEQVRAAAAEWQALVDRALEEYHRCRGRGQRAPYALWQAVASDRWGRRLRAPEYRRASDAIRWYRQEIDAWRAVLRAAGIPEPKIEEKGEVDRGEG